MSSTGGLVGAAIATVGVFLQPEGVDGQGGARTVGRTAQHAIATGIVDIPFYHRHADIILSQVVRRIVEKGCRCESSSVVYYTSGPSKPA